MTRSTQAISRLYRWSDLPRLAGLALLYLFLAIWTSDNLSIKGSVSVLWLPSGLALAALLMGGLKYWPAVFAGSLASLSTEGYPLWRQLGLASGNTLEALIGAWLLLRSHRFQVALMHAEDYLRIFLAGTAGTCASALTGVGTLLLAGRIAPPAVAGSLLHWYQGDILSILLLTPTILVWRRLPGGWFTRMRVVETIACFGLAALLGQITFVGWGQSVFGRPPLGHLAFLFVTWGAVRFGRHGALLLVVMAALQALAGAVLGTGFFSSDPAQFNLNNLWMFLLALTIVGITLALLFHERNLSEQSLRKAEENLRLLTANLSEMVLAYDMNRSLVYANPAVEKLTGYSVASLRQEQFICWVHPEDRARMLGRWDGLFHGGAFAEEEYRLITKDGRQRWAAASWGPIFDDTGRQVGVQGSERDISDRKTTEDALRESEQRFRTLFENAGDAILITQNDLVIDCNARALDVFGCRTRDQLQGHHPYEFSPPSQPNGRDSREFATEKVTAALAGRAQCFEWVHARLDGTIFSTEVSLNGVGLGSSVILQGIVRDITERKRAEETQQRLVTAIEQAGETIVITDPAGAILYANPAFEKTTGFTCAEALGRSPSILKSGKQDTAFYRNMWAMLLAGQVWNGRFINKRKDGTLYEEEATISPVRDTAGRIINYVAVKRDITREVALEEKYRQAQKMESIGRLAGGVAHDFNNLLTVINGYSRMLLDKQDWDEPDRDSLEEIYKAGERAAGLTRQLLAFSRKQVLAPRTLDVNRVVREMRPMLARLVGEDIEVRLALHAEGGMIHADPHQLEQVVMNLVVNARDAMPGAGTLLVETANVVRDESFTPSHPDAPVGRYVMLSVSDSGVGMDETTKNRIFEPFFTTKGIGKGTGLGLAMVQGIVAQSGGHIEVESEPRLGTTFRIYLPSLESAPAGGGEPAVVPARVLRGEETVLVVEDQAEVRKYAADVLGSYGYKVIQAESASEALRLCDREPEHMDLVVTDVVMPNMSGRELADRLARRWPDIKVLFMSGYAHDAIASPGALRVGVGFIQKPFSPAQLACEVRGMLDTRSS
jgi:PAS domain S-box-containing protein